MISFIKHKTYTLPPTQTPSLQVGVGPLHAGTVSEHLQTLLDASQYAPEVKPEQDSDVPHLHFPLSHVSPGTAQG